MTTFSRLTRLLALVLILLLALPVAALADGGREKQEKKERSFWSSFVDRRDDDDDDGYRKRRHDDDEDGWDGDDDENGYRGGGRDEGTVRRDALSAAGSGGMTATPPAPPDPALVSAMTTLAANPGSAQAVDTVRRLLRTAGPGAPRLWVGGKALRGTPVADQNRVLVPLDPVAEALGAQLTRDRSGTVTVTRGTRRVQLIPGSATATIGGAPVRLETAPVSGGGFTYLSLNSLAEILVLQVIYDPETGVVLISEVTSPLP